MTQAQVSVPRKIARSAAVVLAAIFVVGTFVVGFDQGHTLALVQGEAAFDAAYLHELSHDLRHASGFPCH